MFVDFSFQIRLQVIADHEEMHRRLLPCLAIAIKYLCDAHPRLQEGWSSELSLKNNTILGLERGSAQSHLRPRSCRAAVPGVR